MVVVVFLMVETPLIAGLVLGCAIGSGVGVGVGKGDGVGLSEGVAEGAGPDRFIKLTVVLKVRYPRKPRTMMVTMPTINDFMSYIIRL